MVEVCCRSQYKAASVIVTQTQRKKIGRNLHPTFAFLMIVQFSQKRIYRADNGINKRKQNKIVFVGRLRLGCGRRSRHAEEIVLHNVANALQNGALLVVQLRGQQLNSTHRQTHTHRQTDTHTQHSTSVTGNKYTAREQR